MEAPPEFSWFNEINVRVAFGDYPDQPPTEVFSLLVADPDLGRRPWEDDELVAELETLTWTGVKKQRHQAPYTLDVKKSHFSWGADGAVADILLYVANHAAGGLVDAGSVAAVLAVFRKLRNRVKGTDRVVERTPEEIAEFARWRISAAFRDWVSPDEHLELVEEARHLDQQWTAAFTDGNGNRYGIEIHFLDGSPYATRVTRNAPPEPVARPRRSGLFRRMREEGAADA